MKRLIDTLIVLIAAPAWVPVAAVVALAIRVTMGAPVLFVSERAGLGGKAFRFLKFRTMRERKAKARGEAKVKVKGEGEQWNVSNPTVQHPTFNLQPVLQPQPGSNVSPLPSNLDLQTGDEVAVRGEGDGERLTKLGRILRATSLDELPQLLHVLSGKMALVGPRPLPVAYLPRYSAEQMRRHEVRPGITGWAQVNGRNELDWEEKFRLDVWYVDHRSLWLDAKILFLTALKTVRGSGISHAGFDTMYEFRGEGS